MILGKEGLLWLRFLAVMALVQVISLFKISFIVGSQAAFFNGSLLAVPLMGALAGPMSSLALFVVRCGALWFAKGAGAWHMLAFVVPGLCASLYWTTKSSMVRLWLPVACMVAFAVHPVGGSACAYTLYWLIPIAFYFLPHSNVFTHALGSTFVAHAVGSVIWLYTVPMTASMWLALIPVVAAERMLCVAGMVGVCCVYKLATKIASSTWVQIRAWAQ